MGFRSPPSPGFLVGEVSPIVGFDRSSPQLHARSILRPATLTGHTGYSGAFTQFREYGAPGDQVNLFVEGVDGSLLRTTRLNLTFPMTVSIRDDSSTLPLVSDTSGLVLRQPSMEASLASRQV